MVGVTDKHMCRQIQQESLGTGGDSIAEEDVILSMKINENITVQQFTVVRWVKTADKPL